MNAEGFKMKIRIQYLLILALIPATAFIYQAKFQKKQEIEQLSTNDTLILSPADLALVQKDTLDNSIPFNGTLKPWQQVILNAQINAEIRTIHVKPGQSVEAGEVLLNLDTRDIDLRYQQAFSAWQSRKLELEQAQQKYSQVKRLQSRNFASKSDLDFAQRQRDIATEQVTSAKSYVEQITQQQNNARVVAPFAGRVAESFVNVGQLVTTGAPLLKIIEVKKLELEALLPADKALSVTAGQAVSFTVNHEKNPNYQGVVLRINPQARLDNRRVPVYIEVQNSQDDLLAGMFVQGKIIGKSIAGLSLPLSALQETKDGWQVTVLQDQHLVPVSVHLLAKDFQHEMALVKPIKRSLLAGNKVLNSPPSYSLSSNRLVQISQVD